jgi:FKBP-type peptidyl-prolyl cis-trans isomerase
MKNKNQKENIGVIVSFIVVIGIIIFTIYFIVNKKDKVNPLDGIKKVDGLVKMEEGTEAKQQEEQSLPQKDMEQSNRILDGFTPVSSVSKLEKIDLVSGNGTEVASGDTVSVHYTGAVAATGSIFQSSKDFGTNPVTFPLSSVIKGWTDGIPGMKIGGTRRLIIPANMAYGSNPPPNSGIPANADLVFDVELISIQ